MCCNEKMRAHHVNHKIQKNLHFVIHFFNILFFHNRKVGSFHNDISYAPVVDEDSLEALGLLSDHVPHHHQPIQTSSVVLYYSIVRKKPPSTT